MRLSQFPVLPVTLAVAAVVALAACDKPQDNRTAGQSVDAAVAKVEQKSDQAAAEIKKDVASVKAAVAQAVDATATKGKDAAITTSINAELAKDASLSVLKINVDTSAGKVSLRGTAPNVAAREQATLLAQRVDGVVSVDNQLQVSSN
jgi:hyperosmotically inducible periplasmic protein